ncbi:MAG: hypothetical protein QNK23_10790 [Crocinitomicaceae bacterium]|nr:hypothetical protein [Crocinitomicaceae bacterium]
MNVILSVFFVGFVNSLCAQVYVNDSKRKFLFVEDDGVQVWNNQGEREVNYELDDGQYINRNYYENKFPREIVLEDYLQSKRFVLAGQPIDTSLLHFKMVVTDSTIDYRLPCSNADEAILYYGFNYIVKVYYGKRRIYIFEDYSSTTQFSFSEHRDGIIWELKEYTQVWEGGDGRAAFIYTLDYKGLVGLRKSIRGRD